MPLSRKITGGVIGGLFGGIIQGFIIAEGGRMPIMGQLTGVGTLEAGWAIQLAGAILLGALFGLLLGAAAIALWSGLILGLLYGAIWWFLGPLTLVPWLQGASPTWDAAALTQGLASLPGYLAYGGVLGITYAHFVPPLAAIGSAEALEARLAARRRTLALATLVLLAAVVVLVMLAAPPDFLARFDLSLPRGGGAP